MISISSCSILRPSSSFWAGRVASSRGRFETWTSSSTSSSTSSPPSSPIPPSSRERFSAPPSGFQSSKLNDGPSMIDCGPNEVGEGEGEGIRLDSQNSAVLRNNLIVILKSNISSKSDLFLRVPRGAGQSSARSLRGNRPPSRLEQWDPNKVNRN